LTSLIDILWEDWVKRGGDDKHGRAHVLQTIAIQEADKLSNGVPSHSLGYSEQQALPGLETSSLVRVKDERVAFTHDLLGDWARLRVLIGDSPITSASSRDRAQSPRWHKAIRLFGQRILEQAVDGTEQRRACINNVPNEPPSAALMRDLFLESLFLATNASELLERTWAILISNGGALLRRLLDRFLYVATLPDTQLLALSGDQDDAVRLEHAFRVPYWPYWGPVLAALHTHRDDVVRHAPYQTARLVAFGCEQCLSSSYRVSRCLGVRKPQNSLLPSRGRFRPATKKAIIIRIVRTALFMKPRSTPQRTCPLKLETFASSLQSAGRFRPQ
jgi:hypothetical protein